MANDNLAPDQETTRAQRLECLYDAEKRLQDRKRLKKADNKVHNEEITSIEEEIADIMDQLDPHND